MRLFGIDFSNFKPNDFVRSMPIFAAMLTSSDQFRRWVVGGTEAATDGSTVYLPGIALKSPREVMAFLGYATHELGHRFTDMSVLEVINSSLQKSLWNTLEDVHKDQMQHRHHPGSKDVLDALAQYLIDEGLEAFPSEDMPPVTLVQMYIQYRLRHAITGEDAYRDHADSAERLVADLLPPGVLTKLRALMFEVVNCGDSWDVFDLTNNIISMLKQENEQLKQDLADQQAKQNSPADQSQSPADGDGGDAESTQAPDGPPTPGGDDDQGDPDASKDDGNTWRPTPGSQSDVGSGIRTVIDELLGMTDSDAIKTVGDQAKALLNSIAGEQIRSGEFDPDLWYTPHEEVVESADGVHLNTEVDRINGAVNALRFRLGSVIQAQTRSRVTHRSTGTKPSVSRMHKLSYGDCRIFETKVKGMAIDTAIVKLCDRSASMDSNGRMQKALDVTLALSLALDGIKGVQHAAAVFPGRSHDVNGRVLPGIGVIKRFGESAKNGIARCKSIVPSGGTPAHIALAWAGKELLSVKAARKIVFMSTDGVPDDPAAVKDALYDLHRMGIEVVGVGIGVDVGCLFDRFIRVDSVDDMAAAVFGLLRDRLLAA